MSCTYGPGSSQCNSNPLDECCNVQLFRKIIHHRVTEDMAVVVVAVAITLVIVWRLYGAPEIFKSGKADNKSHKS